MFFNAVFGASVSTSSIYTRPAVTFYINGVPYGAYEQRVYMNGIPKGRYYVKIKGYEILSEVSPPRTESIKTIIKKNNMITLNFSNFNFIINNNIRNFKI